MNFAKFIRTAILTEYLPWLLLKAVLMSSCSSKLPGKSVAKIFENTLLVIIFKIKLFF